MGGLERRCSFSPRQIWRLEQTTGRRAFGDARSRVRHLEQDDIGTVRTAITDMCAAKATSPRRCRVRAARPAGSTLASRSFNSPATWNLRGCRRRSDALGSSDVLERDSRWVGRWTVIMTMEPLPRNSDVVEHFAGQRYIAYTWSSGSHRDMDSVLRRAVPLPSGVSAG